MKEKLIITPKTKVLELIETYPELEDILIGYVPAFKKLKNPVLRKTVAKIATLQQAATIGNVRIDVLTNLLRKEVGQDFIETNGASSYQTDRPIWFSEDLVVKELDARPMLANGEHPVGVVISDIQKLANGKIYKLYAPFLPAPLIDKATSLGANHWVVKDNEELFIIYFIKQA